MFSATFYLVVFSLSLVGAQFTFLIDCGSSGMKIFLFTSDVRACPLSVDSDEISTKIGSLADASTKGNPRTNFDKVRAVLEAAFVQAVTVEENRAPGYLIAAYATAGNRIISVGDDVRSWEAFRGYFHVAPEQSKTLHGTEEAMYEFIAVNFSHLRSRNMVPQKDWYNMISTGGASLQLALVYNPEMEIPLYFFFSKVVEAALNCNSEQIPFDWVNVFSATEKGGVMEFESIFEAYIQDIRDQKDKINVLKKEILTIQTQLPTKKGKEQKDLFQLSIDKYAEIEGIKKGIDSVYLLFAGIVEERCVTGREPCFVGISFLGILNAKGICFFENLDRGYHIIAGVDKFRALYQLYYSTPRVPVVIDPRATMLTVDQENEVEHLLSIDTLFPYLGMLVESVKLAPQAPNKKFLPAGNWGTGQKIYAGRDPLKNRPFLAVMVNKLTVMLGIEMAAADVRALRRTDWTFGAAWKFLSYDTCKLGTKVQVEALPKADFALEEQSVSSLEYVLSSFI